MVVEGAHEVIKREGAGGCKTLCVGGEREARCEEEEDSDSH
jgi:hypothetical protein